MRPSTLLFACGAVTAALWTAASGRDAHTILAPDPADEVAARARAGIRGALRQRTGAELVNLVVTQPSAAAPWTARAEARDASRGDGRTGRPLFARMAPACDAGTERPACWRIVHLALDGQVAEAGATGVAGDAAPDRRPAPDPVPAPRVSNVAPVANARPAPAAAIPAPPAPPVPTHKVVASRVNARAAPSLEAKVLDVLDPGAPLILTESRDGWGRFRRASATSDPAPVWISLRLTDLAR